MFKKTLIFLAVIISLLFLMNNVIMPLYVKHSDTVKVPKVTGMNFIEAGKILEEAGLEIKQGDVKYDENIPIGEILDQNPPAEEMVKYGRRIYVTICGGEQLSEVPNLVGRSLRDAKFTLEQRGLKLGETVKKNTTEYPADYVLSQIVQPGSKVKRNTSMDLILSDGPKIGDLKVPNLRGKTLDEAKKLITDSKLKLGKITYQTNNELTPGQVIDQYPKMDKSANEETQVDLFVARKKVVIQTDEDEEAINDGSTTDNSKDDKENTKDKQKIDIKPVPTDKSTDKTDKSTDKTTDKKTDKKTDKPPTIKKEESAPDKAGTKKDGNKDTGNGDDN